MRISALSQKSTIFLKEYEPQLLLTCSESDLIKGGGGGGGKEPLAYVTDKNYLFKNITTQVEVRNATDYYCAVEYVSIFCVHIIATTLFLLMHRLINCVGNATRVCISLLNKSNLHYACSRITPKRVTNGGAHLRGLAPGQHSSEETSQRWRAVGGTLSALTSPEINPMTFRVDSDVSNHHATRPLLLTNIWAKKHSIDQG